MVANQAMAIFCLIAVLALLDIAHSATNNAANDTPQPPISKNNKTVSASLSWSTQAGNIFRTSTWPQGVLERHRVEGPEGRKERVLASVSSSSTSSRGNTRENTYYPEGDNDGDCADSNGKDVEPDGSDASSLFLPHIDRNTAVSPSSSLRVPLQQQPGEQVLAPTLVQVQALQHQVSGSMLHEMHTPSPIVLSNGAVVIATPDCVLLGLHNPDNPDAKWNMDDPSPSGAPLFLIDLRPILGSSTGRLKCAELISDSDDNLFVVACQTQIVNSARCFVLGFELQSIITQERARSTNSSGSSSTSATPAADTAPTSFPWSPLILDEGNAPTYIEGPAGLILTGDGSHLCIPIDALKSPTNAGIAIINLMTGSIAYGHIGSRYGFATGSVIIDVPSSGSSGSGSVLSLVVVAASYPPAAGSGGSSLVALYTNGSIAWESEAIITMNSRQPHPLFEPLSGNIYSLAFQAGGGGGGGSSPSTVYLLCVQARNGKSCPPFTNQPNSVQGALDISSYFSSFSISWVFGGALLPIYEGPGSLRLLYTLSSYPDHEGKEPRGTIVSLDPQTGALLDQYIFPRTSAMDLGILATAPVVFLGSSNKKNIANEQHVSISSSSSSAASVAAIAFVAQSDGSLYVFDASTSLQKGPYTQLQPVTSTGLQADVSSDYLAVTTESTIILMGWHTYSSTLSVTAVLHARMPTPYTPPASASSSSSSRLSTPAAVSLSVIIILMGIGIGLWGVRRYKPHLFERRPTRFLWFKVSDKFQPLPKLPTTRSGDYTMPSLLSTHYDKSKLSSNQDTYNHARNGARQLGSVSYGSLG